MDLKEVYMEMLGDYEDVLSRLRKDERIEKYLTKFKDADYNESLLKAIEQKDYEAAFREAHNLKGVCQNLSLTKLANSASELTDSLRSGNIPQNLDELVCEVEKDYELVIAALKKWSE